MSSYPSDNEFGLVQNIHLQPLLLSFYSLSVLSAGSIYVNPLIIVSLIPAQAALMDSGEGPNYFYIIAALVAIFEYYIWALQIASYWFKPEEVKILYLSDKTLMDEWKKKSLYWGSGLTVMMLGQLQGALNKLDQYVVSKEARIYFAATFALQNWLFYGYLYSVEYYYPQFTADPTIATEEDLIKSETIDEAPSIETIEDKINVEVSPL